MAMQSSSRIYKIAFIGGKILLLLILVALFIPGKNELRKPSEVNDQSTLGKLDINKNPNSFVKRNVEIPLSQEITTKSVDSTDNSQRKLKIPDSAHKIILPNGRSLRMKLPKEGNVRTVHSQGKIYKLDSEGNVTDKTPPPVFDNPAEERLIGMAVEGGSFIPGFIKGMGEKETIALLTKPVVIYDDDPEDVKMKKEAVALLKENALAYIQEGGGTFDDFVDEMASYAKEERKLKAQGLREVMYYLRKGKVEEARVFKKEFDSVMAEQGFPSLKLPKKFMEMMK